MSDLPPGWDLKDFKTIEIPPEHKDSLGDTFKYIQDSVLERNKMIDQYVEEFNETKRELVNTVQKEFGEEDWNKRLEERKRIYRASGKGIDFNKERTDEEEDERMQVLAKEIIKVNSPSNDVAGVYLPSAYGADIEAEQVFQRELHGIVDDMKVKLVDEKKILEGTLNPEYGKGDWGLPSIEKTMERIKTKHEEWLDKQNELSQTMPVEEQWKTDSPSGSWITDLTPISRQESNSSSSTAEPSSPSYPTTPLIEPSMRLSINLCQGMSVGCGCETGVTNESCACMEQTINVPTVGMLNVEK